VGAGHKTRYWNKGVKGESYNPRTRRNMYRDKVAGVRKREHEKKKKKRKRERLGREAE
jgi:hypothetical protein